MPKQLTIESYQKLASDRGGEFVGNVIPKNIAHVAEGWKCAKCGEIFKRSYGNLKLKERCECTNCSRRKPTLKLEDFQKAAERYGGEFLLDRVPGGHEHVCRKAWKCEQGHVFDKSYRNVVDGWWCTLCSGFKKTLKDYEELAAKFGGTFVGDIPQSSVHRTTGWRCKRDHEMNMTYHYVSHGYWCNECERIETKESKLPCKYVGKTGSNKGHPCVEPASNPEEDGYCHRHFMYLKMMEKRKEKKQERKEIKEEEEKTKDILELVLPFDQKEVRIIGTFEQPWFVAKDVAEILGYKKTRNAIEKHVDDEDKKKINEEPCFGALQLHPETVLVNESGLYSLILKSKLPKAKEFKRWVTSEVLPSIRKKGTYHQSEEKQQEFLALNQRLKQITTEKKALLEENKKLTKTVNKHVKKYNYQKLDVEGPCYYIYSASCFEKKCKGVKIKAGSAGIGDVSKLDDRLRSHRTLDGNMTLELVIMSSEETIVLLEKGMLSKHNEDLKISNHEIFASKQVLDKLRESAISLIEALSPNSDHYNIMPQERIDEYHDKILSMLDKK